MAVRSPAGVIEIVGPPGAGKSTLARALVQELGARGTSAHWSWAYRQAITQAGAAPAFRAHWLALARARLRALRDAAGFFPHLRRACRGAIAPADSGVAGWLRLLRLAGRDGLPLHLFARHGAADECLVLEPGWKMNFIGGYFYAHQAPRRVDLDRFLDWAPPVRLTVGLTVTPATALDRLHGRERGLPRRMRALPEAAWPEVIERGNRATRMLCERIVHRGEPVTVLDASTAGPDDLARTLADGVR